MRRFLVTISLALSALVVAIPAHAQTTSTDVEETKAERVFGPADFDVLVSLGFGAFLYPHVDASLDIGLVPIGDDMTIAIGGGIDLGYCVLCGLLELATDVDIGSTYWNPYGRVEFHLGTLGGLLDAQMDQFTLDPHVGLFGGPSFYQFNFSVPGVAEVEAKETSFLLGPVVGLRLGMANNTFLLFGEYRFTAEFGYDSVVVTDSAGNEHRADDAFRRGGSDFLLGLGLRI